MRSVLEHRVSRSARAVFCGVALAAAAALPVSAATSVSDPGPLGVTISGADSALIGTAYPVTVVATNTTATPTTASAHVTFFVPLGSQLQGAIANSTGAACARVGGGANGALVVCPIPSLAPGASATIGYSVVPQSLGTLNLGATASDEGTTVTSAEISVPIAPAPTDLQVTGSASTGSPTLGSTFSYTFQVKDNGPWPAPGVTFSDTLPASLSLLGSTATAGTCTAVGNSVSCSIGDLATGGQSNVVITVQAPTSAQSITNIASVAMGVSDRQPANNAVSVAVQVK